MSDGSGAASWPQLAPSEARGPERGVGVICGPTGAGKSALAMRLALQHGRALVSADSRQVYRRFDIGTAKPSTDDRSRVQHIGIDVSDPTQRFSAADWVASVRPRIDELGQDTPIVVGGTGLYLRALFDGLFAQPTIDPGRRTAMLGWLDGQSTDELRRWTSAIDPSRAHLGRTQLLRALEIALLTGERISHLHRTRAREPGLRARYLVIDPGQTLHARIAARLDAMLDAGWLDEVAGLADLPDDAPGWKATGYQTIRNVVRGTMSLDEARERILIDTRQYAKRQRTWFRHQLPVYATTRLDPEREDVDAVVARWWDAVDGAGR